MPDTIPFRFKGGGGNMAPGQEPHHHRSSSKLSHKSFKSRHATKSLLREISKGKVERLHDKVAGSRKTPHQQAMSKLERRNQAKQIRHIKNEANARTKDVFAGINGAPRIIAVVPLCVDIDVGRAIERLNEMADAEVVWPLEGQWRVRVDRFKQNLHYIPVQKNLLEAADACRAADFVIFLLSPTEEPTEEDELMLRTLEGQGMSNVYTMVQGLDTITQSKRRSQISASLKTYITHFFPTQERVISLDSDSECASTVRSLCTTTPKGIRWRECRSWMLAENVSWPDIPKDVDSTEVMITGVVRGKGLNADRLVQVGDWGYYQISKITRATAINSKKRKVDEMAVEEADAVLQTPTSEQENLDELAPYEADMRDAEDVPVANLTDDRKGVLLDDHHYYSDDEAHLPEQPKKLPKGTSNYQSAWFLGDMSDSGSDYDDSEDVQGDVAMDSPAALPQDGVEGLDQNPRDPTEMASEYPQSEMFLDPSPTDEANQIAEYRASRKDEAKDDLEFPDEVEMHPNVLARERLARYRGLKSLKTSSWATEEDRAYQPEDWARLLPVPDFKRAQKKVLNDTLIGGVQPGTRVIVTLKNVPLAARESCDSSRPLAIFSLLLHEQKQSVVNISITLSSDHEGPLRSKEDLIMQCGARRFTINPLFSQHGNTPNNVHKFVRYLHPGQTAVASFIAPVTWGPVPALFFKTTTGTISPTAHKAPSLNLVATGTVLPASTARIIAKRIIITGHPYKIHKKLVTVRYMFFNSEDVHWFKALQLWTKRGRSGFIKESLGTHGYFKATFDGRINPQDAVGVSLYKRVFPRPAIPWTSKSQHDLAVRDAEVPELVDDVKMVE